MRRTLPALLVSLLLSACSLPLPNGVRGTDGVQAEPKRDGEVLQVKPPGWQEGQSPQQVVTGFLQAQANADADHAIARSFLTRSAAEAWDDTVQVQVYDLPSQTIKEEKSGEKGPDTEKSVTVTAQVIGLIGSDGRYTPQDLTTQEDYRLERVDGDWRLSSVPSGLRLTAADRARSYPPFTVFHVIRTPVPTQQRLVPERVFLASGPGLPARLVERSLRRPSGALADTVVDRAGVEVRSVRADSAGVVSVDLGPEVNGLTPEARRGLSAQLVWTLRNLGTTFSGMRLLAAGQPLRVPGEDAVQDDQSWDSFDPSGLPVDVPFLSVDRRRLTTSPGLVLGETGTVDDVALAPDASALALLSGRSEGPVTVRIGAPAGPTYDEVLRAPGLAAPSYGSGWRGLWMIRDGRDLVLLPTGRRALVQIPITGGMPPGDVTALAVSRDGTHVAVVVAERLFVGVVVGAGTSARVVELVALLPEAVVDDVAWTSGTELTLVGHVAGSASQLLRVAIDGSALENLNTAARLPEAVAASPAGVLFTSGGVVYSYTGRNPTRIVAGSVATYPG